MIPIELTDLHKSKLLEMCKELFPEYFYWEVSKKQFIQSHIVGNDAEIYEDEKPDLNIHWFEFCMTYLADKIFEDHDNFSNIKDSFITIFSIKDEHPIDYIYEQFKQLKQ